MPKQPRFSDYEGAQEINLSLFTTPMLDMAFQLLAFFVMFYRPGLLIEGYVHGKLMPPEKVAIQSDQAKKKPEKKEILKDKPPEIKEKITVFIEAVKDGQFEGDRGPGMLSQIKLKSFGTDAETVADSSIDVATSMQKLKGRMEGLFKRVEDGGQVYLQPDGNLKYDYVVRVWNACKDAGFEKISFSAPTSGVK